MATVEHFLRWLLLPVRLLVVWVSVGTESDGAGVLSVAAFIKADVVCAILLVAAAVDVRDAC